MDEHGIALRVCTNSRVLASYEKRRTYVQSHRSRKWVSIIETISALGNPIRPLIIFKGSTPKSTWFPDNSPGLQYTKSENGWTCNSTAINWLKYMSIPETQPVSGGHRISNMDGHGSNTSTKFLWTCRLHDVELLFLPAHSSHVLQPLDLGVFAPLKSKYRSQIANLTQFYDAAFVKKRKFVSCYHIVRNATFNSRVLRYWWKAVGLFPWKVEKGLNSSQVLNPIERPSTPPSTSNSTLDESP